MTRGVTVNRVAIMRMIMETDNGEGDRPKGKEDTYRKRR